MPPMSQLNEVIALLAAHPEFTAARIAEWCASPDPAQAERGAVLEVARRARDGQPAEALRLIAPLQVRRAAPSLALFLLQLDLRRRLGQEDQLPADFLDFGCRAVAAGELDLGCEAIGTAFVEDADRYLKLIYEQECLRRAAAHYEMAACRLASRVAPRAVSGGARIRLGLVVANLVDDVVAYARRVMDFARYLDARRFELRVYSSENMCIRRHQLPARCVAQPSSVWGHRSLAELAARGVPVYLTPREQPLTVAALELANRMAADGLDIVIMQSGPTMPIDWLAVRLAPAPVKLHIHIGAPNYMAGMDATIFDNEINLERERPNWPAYAGRLELIRQGTDIAAIDAQPAARRADYELPPDAVLVGVLSNHLDRRLSPEYLRVMAETLQACPEAWFVPIGQTRLPPRVGEYFERAGVGARVRHIPVQRHPAGVLKMLDIYANEFPVGGSQAVVEAMVCARPVVALRSGPTHVESAGADIVGAPFALDSNNPRDYAERLLWWVRDPVAREDVGAALRRRAEAHYSIADYVRRIGDYGAEILARKTVANPGPPPGPISMLVNS